MADEIDEDAGWPGEDINQVVTDACTSILEPEPHWNEAKVPLLIDEICGRIMKELVERKLPYKFIVTCMLIQKTDKPLMSSCSVNWENNSDGIENVIFPPLRSKESANKTLQCNCTVMGVRF